MVAGDSKCFDWSNGTWVRDPRGYDTNLEVNLALGSGKGHAFLVNEDQR